jgi:hypothetical protein
MISRCVAVISVHRDKIHLNSSGFKRIAQTVQIRLNLSRSFPRRMMLDMQRDTFFRAIERLKVKEETIWRPVFGEPGICADKGINFDCNGTEIMPAHTVHPSKIINPVFHL